MPTISPLESLKKKVKDELDRIIPGGLDAGVQRVKQTPLKEYFLPTSSTAGPVFRELAIKPLTEGAKSAVKLTPPYQAYRAATGKPVTPRETLSDVASVARGVGAVTLGPAGYAVSAGIGAVTNPKHPVIGAFEGVKMGQQFGGLSRFTSPVISRVLPKIQKFAPSLTGRFGEKVAQGALNIGENVVQDIATDRKTTPWDIVLSAATGATFRPFTSKVPSPKVKFRMSTNTIDELVEADEILRNPEKFIDSKGYFNTPVARQNAIEKAKYDAEQVINTLAAKYLPKKQFDQWHKTGNTTKMLDSLYNLNRSNRLANVPVMGFAENKNMPLTPEGKFRLKPATKNPSGFQSVGQILSEGKPGKIPLTSEGKIRLKTSGNPPPEVPQIPNEYQKLNVNKLNLPQEERLRVRSLETDEPRVILKNADVVKMSDLTEGGKAPINMEETKRKLAQQLNSRQKVVSLEQEFMNLQKSGAKPKILQNKLEDIAKQTKIARTEGTEAGRQLQARNILADSLATPMQKVFRLLDNAGIDEAKYVNDAAKVDWNNAEQVVNFYRRYVPPKFGDWIDVIRYNSMLSSPNTHIINTFSNLLNTSFVTPIEKSLTGTLDFLGSKVSGRERTRFVAEGPLYIKGYVGAAGDAAKNFWNTLQGKNAIKNLDLDYVPMGTEGKAGRILKTYTFPTRALEAVDQFFTTMAEGGERAGINYRLKKGVAVTDPESLIKRKAAYSVFRSDLKDADQGVFLNAIDELTGLIQQARTSGNPIVRTVSKFTLPFVKTPMNILKQGVEYSPAGILTIPGAKNKTEQLSKVLIGSAAMTATAMLAASGRTQWAEPTDPKKKQAFRDAGLQPYSIKVGDKWISFAKLPPAIGFPIALVAALHDAEENRTIDQTQFDSIVEALAKSGKFFADQSYLKNIGDLINGISNDPEKWSSLLSNYPQQLVPWRAFLGWTARLIDPYQRKVNYDEDFFTKQIQQLETQVPFLSQRVPARTNEAGEPIPNQNRFINAVSPLRINTERPDQKEYFDLLKKQSLMNKNLEVAKEMMESGQEIPPGLFDVKAADEEGSLATERPLTKLQREVKIKEIKTRMELGRPITAEEYILVNDFDKYSTLSSNSIKAKQQTEKLYEKVADVLDDPEIDGEMRNQIFNKLGVTQSDIEYDQATRLPDDLQMDFVIASIEEVKTWDEIYQDLLELRKISKGSRKMLLTDTIVNKLVDNGYLSENEGEIIKSYDHDSGTYKPKKKKLKIGKSVELKPIQIKVASSMPQINFSGPSGPRLKLNPAQRREPSKLRLKKLSSPRIKIKPTYYQTT